MKTKTKLTVFKFKGNWFSRDEFMTVECKNQIQANEIYNHYKNKNHKI